MNLSSRSPSRWDCWDGRELEAGQAPTWQVPEVKAIAQRRVLRARGLRQRD